MPRQLRMSEAIDAARDGRLVQTGDGEQCWFELDGHHVDLYPIDDLISRRVLGMELGRITDTSHKVVVWDHSNKIDGELRSLNGYAPGGYICKCCDCEKEFQGDKRSVTCFSCAFEPFGLLIAGAGRALVAVPGPSDDWDYTLTERDRCVKIVETLVLDLDNADSYRDQIINAIKGGAS